MTLREIDVRILGSLLEKERTTPDGYPLSTKALLAACNQKTNRDPVIDLHLRDLEDALRALRDRGLVRSRRGDGERAVKHEHRLLEAFSLGAAEMAVLAVLMLRGRQTPGELRLRTERYLPLPDLDAVERALLGLTSHQPPLAENHGRGPGQSQDRWSHTFAPDPERLRPRVRPPGGGDARPAQTPAVRPRPDATAAPQDAGAEIAALRRQVAALRVDLDRVLEALAMQDDPGDGG